MRRALIALTLAGAPMPAAAQHDHGAPPAAQPDHSGHQDHAMLPAPPAPPSPGDHAADAIFGGAAMARARASLARESGGMAHAMLLIDRLEWQARKGADGYTWEAEMWVGGDIDRLTIKSEGEGIAGGPLDDAEVQALWSHAVDPWWNLQLGVRQDIRPAPARSYVAAGIEGLAPYWFKVTATAFLSDKGDLMGRVEASHDVRLTQRVIATPRIEARFSAQDVAEQGIGAGLSELELGLRLHYAFSPRLAPYVGVEWAGALGDSARYARAAGDDARRTSMVTGVRLWF
ncbi:copper resistance protein B [Sphingobium sp. AN641]|uniref:copper resistance protein B n=1 Tax=Sphingobium sp. AN641 TaxID=3133443 RepID=UPI0030BF0E6A